MGCCPSTKISPITDSIRPIAGPSNKSNQADNVVRNTDEKTRSTQVKKDRFKGDSWISSQYIREARQKINSVTRMGYINTYFDARQEVKDEFKSMTRPRVPKGELWLDKELLQKIPEKKEKKQESITWKRPKVSLTFIIITYFNF